MLTAEPILLPCASLQEIATLTDGDVVKYSNRISSDYAGEYSLFFANCLEETVVSFDIRVSLYNVDSSGSPDFLSVGETELPIIYMVWHMLHQSSQKPSLSCLPPLCS